MAFDSIQIKFKNVKQWSSPLANSRVVPFVESYFNVIKSCINDIRTEYFWVFPSFMSVKQIDFDFIPEQFEKDQIHVWYSGHPKAGHNKEGNVLLIPTKQFKEQMKDLKFLRDYKDINYHEINDLWYPPLTRFNYKLYDIVNEYNGYEQKFYKWMVNKDLYGIKLPNFFPSFWEDEKLYAFGKTKDIMLVPYKENIKQFYDFDRIVYSEEFEYNIKPMDIVFISYDEPKAEERFKKLKSKYPRAKWCKGIKGRTQAYHAAANLSETDYFFAVFPTIELDDSFDFTFQPDRMKHPCHYIFHAKNPVTGLEYGHRAVILYNKNLCLSTTHPNLDFTLSQPHTVIPQLCGISYFNQTPEISWRVAFREVLKLCEMKSTVESKYRLKKWCELGKGQYALLVQKGALDAVEYYKEVNGDKSALMLSYELEWLKEKFNSIS